MKIQRNKIRSFFLLLKDSRFKLIANIRRYPIKVYDITSFPPLRFPHTIRIYQARFKLNHRSKNSSMISFPRVRLSPMNYLSDEDYTGAPVCLPSLRRWAFNNFIEGGVVRNEGECSHDEGTV